MITAKEYTIPEDVVSTVVPMLRGVGNVTSLPIEKIEEIKSTLSSFFDDAGIFEDLENGNGMVCVRFEIPSGMDLTQDIVLSSSLFHLINSCLYNPAPEPKNGMPFTTFKSSANNPEKMRTAGVKFYTPDEKLGYHNDVFLQGDRYYIPKYVSLMNLFIGYDSPGNFYYVNQKIWTEFDNVFEKGVGKTFKFRPTPVVYESHMDEDVAKSPADTWVDVNAFWFDRDGKKYAFSNGELKDNDDTTAVSELKRTLLENPEKVAIPQRVHQAMIFRNDVGFHSRDIFKDQQVFEGTTRLFLRAVSEDSIEVPRQQGAAV